MKKAEMNRNEMPLPNRKILDLAAQRTQGNISALADMIGVSQQSLDRLFKIDKRNGNYPSVSKEIKKALKEKLGIDEIYLLTAGDISHSGNGNFANTGGSAINNTTNNNHGYGRDRMDTSDPQPVRSYTSGRPYFNVDFIAGFDIVLNDQTVQPEYNIDFKPYNKDGVMWCNITGHSMEPLISNGDIIAIKELNDWRDFIPSGEVYGIVTDEIRTVKKVTGSDKGNDFLKLIPVNSSPEYQPQDIPIRLIRRVFQVLGCMKKI